MTDNRCGANPAWADALCCSRHFSNCSADEDSDNHQPGSDISLTLDLRGHGLAAKPLSDGWTRRDIVMVPAAGSGGIRRRRHASWDLGDMTGATWRDSSHPAWGCRPEFSVAEGRLGRYLLKLLGPDGLVHDPGSGAIDHSFSQGSALFGLLAWFEDSGDPAVRRAIERLISGQLQRMERRGDQLVDQTGKLEEASGSHLAGYQIWPVIRFYELTGYADALTLAEGLTRWALADPVLGADGAIGLSWEGHIHSGWKRWPAASAQRGIQSRSTEIR
jgi:hypothetical protein